MPQENGQTPYDRFARYYDRSDLDRAPEIAFYTALIREKDRALLELACGTGTITVKLADQIVGQHGLSARIVGVDESARMLDVARTRQPKIEWILGDMRDPPVQGSFDIVICPFNTLQLLLTDSDLSRTFRAVQKLLNPDGLFAFDIYQPNLEYLNSPPPERVVRSFTDQQGRALEVRESLRYEPSSAVLSVDWCVLDAAGDQLVCLPLKLRQYLPSEIENVLRTSGLQIRERFGNINRAPFTPQSKKQITVAGLQDF